MANFGDIQSNISFGAGQSIRRNAGDTEFEAYTPSSGGSGSLTEIEIDFGTIPQTSKVFTVTDVAIAPTNKIIAFQSGNVATGRVGNDAEWDSIMYSAKAGTGNFELTAFASGAVVGKRKVFYQVF